MAEQNKTNPTQYRARSRRVERRALGEGTNMVKREGHLMEKVTDWDNIVLAYRNASRGRGHTRGVIEFRQNKDENLRNIQKMLKEGTYKSSEYHRFDRKESGKVRHIAALPFYPDRVVHWAVIQATQHVFIRNFIAQTYAAIPGRGTHTAIRDLKRGLRDPRCTWCAKFDVRHYFESIDKTALLEKLARRIKDPEVMGLYTEIVKGYDGPGIPIGNLTSQYLANLYLSDIDHYMKETMHAKYYYRYMDDIVILGWNRAWLRRLKTILTGMLADIGLVLNPRWQIFPIAPRGVDFVGYRIWSAFSLLRRRTKARLIRKSREIVNALRNGASPTVSMRSCLASYHGILSWCDGTRLHRRYIDPALMEMERALCRP